MIELIDLYWNRKMNESELIEYLTQLVNNNKEKVFTNNEFTSIIQQRLGKKRLELLKKILKIKEGNKENIYN
jgi:uncharacterized protein (TIGR04540 family)